MKDLARTSDDDLQMHQLLYRLDWHLTDSVKSDLCMFGVDMFVIYYLEQ